MGGNIVWLNESSEVTQRYLDSLLCLSCNEDINHIISGTSRNLDEYCIDWGCGQLQSLSYSSRRLM